MVERNFPRSAIEGSDNFGFSNEGVFSADGRNSCVFAREGKNPHEFSNNSRSILGFSTDKGKC